MEKGVEQRSKCDGLENQEGQGAKKQEEWVEAASRMD